MLFNFALAIFNFTSDHEASLPQVPLSIKITIILYNRKLIATTGPIMKIQDCCECQSLSGYSLFCELRRISGPSCSPPHI